MKGSLCWCTVAKPTETQTLWSRRKPSKMKDKGGIVSIATLVSPQKEERVRLVMKHTSATSCQWSMRGSRGGDGRRRENTDTQCVGAFFLGFHFGGLSFPKIGMVDQVIQELQTEICDNKTGTRSAPPLGWFIDWFVAVLAEEELVKKKPQQFGYFNPIQKWHLNK